MTSPTAEPATSASSTLYFGPWYRRSPFFEKTLDAGCSAYDIYNHMWARGVATHAGVDVKVREPEVYPVQVQGPKSKDVMQTLFGDAVLDIQYYWTMTTELDGIPVVISRTGWTGEVGYEIYLRDPSRGGDLWDRIMEAGRPHNIRPIAPCEARRIEAGIFNYGSDMTIADTPFHVMGLERLVEKQNADYIGKAALEEIRTSGVDRKLVGIEVAGDALPFELSRKCDALSNGKAVGTVTDLIWSPRLEKNIGYVWVPIDLAGPGNALEIVAPHGGAWPATTAAIPFLDPKKSVPLG